jgi:hypothetical protein
MDVVARDRVHHGLRDDVDREGRITVEGVTHRRESGFRHHQRARRPSFAGEKPFHDEAPFDHEESSPCNQFRVGDVPVVVDSRVIRLVDAYEIHR